MSREVPKLSQWRLFLNAVEQGSFANVAELTGLEVASVSRAIADLEKHVGEALLVRTRRGVYPTWTGAQAYRQIHPILSDMDSVIASFTRRPIRETGLRVAVPSFLGSYLVATWITTFVQKHPDIKVDIVIKDEMSPEIFAEFDLSLVAKAVPNARVIATPLGEMVRGLVASPHYLHKYGTPDSPEDLTNHRLFGEKESALLFRYHDDVKESILINLSSNIRTNSLRGLITPALMSAGISVGVLLHSVDSDIQEGKLQRVLPEWQVLPLPMWIVRQPLAHENKLVLELIDWIKKQWKNTSGLQTR